MELQKIKLGRKLVAASVGVAVSTIFLWHSTATALPSDALALQGHFSATAQFFYKSPVQPAPQRVYPFAMGGVTLQAAGSAILQMPQSAVFERYEVYVKDGNELSASVFVNRAEPWFQDAKEIVAGGTHRICGRNLLLTPGLSRVWYKPVAGGTAVAATPVASTSTEHYLEVTVPGLNPGAYTVSVSTGYGNDERQALETTVTVLAPGADTLGLGYRVPFARKYDYGANVYDIRTDSRLEKRHNGDGSDAVDAINKALTLAGNAVVNGVRGGVVRLTGAGKRYLINGGITIPSYAALQCTDGAELYTSGSQPGYANALNSYNTVRAGLLDINYVNYSNTSTVRPHQNASFNGCTEFLIKGGNYNLGEGLRLDMRDCTRPVWLDVKIQQGITPNIDARQGPVLLLGCKDILLYSNENCPVDYKVGAWSIWQSTGIVDGLRMRWNGYEGNPERVVNHVVALDHCHELMIRNCFLTATYVPGEKDLRARKLQNPGDGDMAGNDGEGFINEQPGGSDAAICGTGTGWSATRLFDNSKNFRSLGLSLPNVVRIVAGRGNGQWRTVTGIGANNELILDRPWDVIPSTDPANPSRYLLSRFTADRIILEKNRTRDLKRAILFYFSNTIDVIVAKNHLLRSGPIDFTPRCSAIGGSNLMSGPQAFAVHYGSRIVDNIVDGRGDTKQAAAILYHQAQYVQPQTFGTSCINAVIKRNEVWNDNPDQDVIIDADFKSGIWGGMQFQWWMYNFQDNPNRPCMMNFIVEDNLVVGCKYYVRSSTGNLNFLANRNRYKNCPQGFFKETYDGNTTPGRNVLELGSYQDPNL